MMRYGTHETQKREEIGGVISRKQGEPQSTLCSKTSFWCLIHHTLSFKNSNKKKGDCSNSAYIRDADFK